MNFPTSYFENEIRDGFFIPGMIKRSWAMQLEILGKIDEVCRKHNLKWYAEYGTLIGAVRHAGFIPWDDDLDISMFREDYIKFNQLVKDELPAEYKILNFAEEPDYEMFITRVCNNTVIGNNSKYLMENHGFPYVAGVDIFPLDYVNPDKKERDNQLSRARTIYSLIENLPCDTRNEAEIIGYAEEKSRHKIDCQLPLKAGLFRILEAIFAEYKGTSDTVASMYFYTKNNNHIYPKKWFEKILRLPFENTYVNVPAGYDSLLSTNYGNWFVINKRGGLHNYPLFKMQQDTLISEKGVAPYVYISVSPKDLSEKRKAHAIVCNNDLALIEALSKMAEQTNRYLEAGTYDNVLALLKKMQEIAISLGNALENEKGENLATVHSLELLCEKIFDFYQVVSQGMTVSGYSFSELINEIQELYKKEFVSTGDVIFLLAKASEYEGVKGLIKNRQQLSSVYIMPIPYFERLDDGQMGQQYYDYQEFENIIDNIQLLKYNEYDFEKNHPAEFIFTCPFDEYQSAVTVHPFFYSENIKYRTEKLTFCHNYKLDFIDSEDLKSIESARTFVVSPGVVNADEIVVPSENMKKIYTAIMSEYENLKDMPEKIVIIPELKAEKNESKEKSLLFYAGICDYYTNPQDAIKWLDRVVDTFIQVKGKLKIFWIEEDNITSNLQNACPEVMDDYHSIKKKFNDNNLGDCISFPDLPTVINSISGYYGAGGYAMNQCNQLGIPIMVRNIDL